MEASAPPKRTILRLVRTLTDDTRTLLREEAQLAKTEIAEKIAQFSRDAAGLAVGGLIAYAGLIVTLIGLGWLIAWALKNAGLQPLMAGFLGLAIVGVVVAGIGTALFLRGLRLLSKESIAPQKTIHTIQRLKGAEAQPQRVKETKPARKQSSEEIQAQVEATENRMTETLDELGYRLSPRHLNAQMKHRIQEKPYRAGLVAIVAGLVSGLVLSRDSRRS